MLIRADDDIGLFGRDIIGIGCCGNSDAVIIFKEDASIVMGWLGKIGVRLEIIGGTVVTISFLCCMSAFLCSVSSLLLKGLP